MTMSSNLTARNVHLTRWLRAIAFAVLVILPASAAERNLTPPAGAEPQAANPSQEILKPEELEALVAPIALYPDTLLALILMASTYPLEVVQAERWVSQNGSLKGDQLKAAVDKQPWEESVRSLAATPSVLTMMSTQLEWTKKLGDTALAQEADLMDAVQRLRSKAYANKKLESNKQQTVTVSNVKPSPSGSSTAQQSQTPSAGATQPTQSQPRPVITIASTQPDTVHVPYYDPGVVYGAWPYPAYPAYYWPPPGYIAAGVVATGLAFGAGYALGRWASGGYWGGAGVNWNNNNLIINNSGNRFQHRPEHRHGVRYNNPGVAQKFGGNRPSGSQSRMDFRGHSGKQVLQPKIGQQPKAVARQQPKGGKGQQAKAGQQPKGGMGQQAKGGMGQQPKGGMGQQVAGGMGQPKGGMGQGGGMGQPKAATRGPSPGASGPRRDSAMNIQPGRSASQHANRGRSSFAQAAGGRPGGFSGGGPRGGRGAGGRRSDVALKHNIGLLGHLDNGLGFYRFEYVGSSIAYVGVMAQEVQLVRPSAVTRGGDGYLRVYYGRLGLPFQTYDQWVASGARIPSLPTRH
jgi:hypothetical protein